MSGAETDGTMYEVSIEGRFTSEHAIRRADGSWEPRHDHEWHVEVYYRRPDLDEYGLVVDFVEAQRFLHSTLAKLNGTSLNDHPEFSRLIPTAEIVARWIAEALRESGGDFGCLHRVVVEEAPGCKAAFLLDDPQPPQKEGACEAASR